MNAQEIAFHIGQANSGFDLRHSYQLRYRGRNLEAISKPDAVAIGKAVISKLYRLGLDLDNTDDSRVANLWTGYDAVNDSDRYGLGRPHTTDRPEAAFFSAYYRILSAMRVDSDTRLQLRPPAELRAHLLFREIAASALHFTRDEQHTTPDKYPRKATRTITKVDSPFWDFTIATDTYPGAHFGQSGSGPSASVTIPTGAITDRAVRGLRSHAYLTNSTWRKTTGNGYLPEHLTAQSIRMGVPNPGIEQVDTTDGQVEAFLRYAGTA